MDKIFKTKETLIKALSDDKLFSEYQLSFYYEFNKIVDVKVLDDFEAG